MKERGTRVLLVVVALLLAAMVAQPFVERFFLAQTVPRPVAARGDLSDFERASVEVFETISPSVVQVGVLADGQAVSQSGTGFVWDEAGHIVTNNHVVAGGNSILVRFSTGEVVPATLRGTAPGYDLAVLHVTRSAAHPPPVPLGSAAELRVGQVAFAIGNPFGLDQSLTFGIISALQRRLPTSGGREIADVIQTDAAINPGNSGGPLLDSAGRLIGVNTAIFSPSGTNAGIGFAIPVDVANRVVPTLIRTGRFPTPGIGIVAADEALAARLGLPGVVVGAVVPGSPADAAGLVGIDGRTGTIGDIIVEADGRPVRRLTDLAEQLEAAGVGAEVSLKVERGGDRRELQVEVVDIGRG
jgi:2-alkenal reductase